MEWASITETDLHTKGCYRYLPAGIPRLHPRSGMKEDIPIKVDFVSSSTVTKGLPLSPCEIRTIWYHRKPLVNCSSKIISWYSIIYEIIAVVTDT